MCGADVMLTSAPDFCTYGSDVRSVVPSGEIPFKSHFMTGTVNSHKRAARAVDGGDKTEEEDKDSSVGRLGLVDN